MPTTSGVARLLPIFLVRRTRFSPGPGALVLVWVSLWLVNTGKPLLALKMVLSSGFGRVEPDGSTLPVEYPLGGCTHFLPGQPCVVGRSRNQRLDCGSGLCLDRNRLRKCQVHRFIPARKRLLAKSAGKRVQPCLLSALRPPSPRNSMPGRYYSTWNEAKKLST